MTIATTADGVRVAYDDLGRGEPALLLLTGWCSSRARWTDVARRCSEFRRVVSLDWRGHGDSDAAPSDFGREEMVQDALAVIEASGVGSFVPCSASHSGWVAIELRRRLPERVPALIHLDWMVLEPPPRYLAVIDQLTTEDGWSTARDILFEIWRAGVDTPEVRSVVDVMAAQGEEMWRRSGREIGSAYASARSPLAALSALATPPRVLHVYGQPRDPAYLAAQEDFAAANGWFSVRQIGAETHFSMVEQPLDVGAAIEQFVRSL